MSLNLIFAVRNMREALISHRGIQGFSIVRSCGFLGGFKRHKAGMFYNWLGNKKIRAQLDCMHIILF